MRCSTLAFVVWVLGAWAGPAAPPLHGQTIPSAPGRRLAPGDSAAPQAQVGGRAAEGVTAAELVDRLRQSGLTREEAQIRLRRLGYDPTIVDPYYDAMEAGGEPPDGPVAPGTLEALSAIGVPVAGEAVAPPEAVPGGAEAVGPPSGPPATPAPAGDALEIFGRSVFRRETSEFESDLLGPVDPDYRLGPGDEVALVLTGDVELSHTLPVTREGYLIIPDVGQVSVNGLTLAQLEERLYERLGRVYSGVRRGPEATTHFQVSLGRLRSNQVYVIGEVERPSAYRVGAGATVFEALYRAGGPSRNGSFRAVRVYRGGELVATVDLYEYLLHGRSGSDVRLGHGDRVFVPPYERRVTVRGAVRRPAIYELKSGEHLGDALAFAGGLRADAIVERVQIDRILPAERRRPGVDRVLMDVDVSRVSGADSSPVELHDGDVIEIFAVSEERRNRVVVTGEVQRPGVYEWSEGLTLWDVIEKAQGLAERAYTPRAHIHRLVEADGSRRMVRTPLLADSTGAPVQDVVLADRDSIVIFSRAELRNDAFVRIDGFVKRPGAYALADGMTVQDLVLAAGGFAEGADTREAEVAVLADEGARSDTTATIIRVPLGGAQEPPSGEAAGVGVKAVAPPAGRPGDVPAWPPDSAEYRLEAGDRVFIRKAVGYEPPRTVKVTGHVLIPGTYVLESREERIADVIRRAGGLTPQGYAPGLQLFRDGKLVATDLAAALSNERGRHNLVLQSGDSLHIPEYSPTVLVTGAVAFETLVLYEPGKSLDYYINRAGGYLDLADKGRVTVTYVDGERAITERSFLLFKKTPRVAPGSTIRVPLKLPSAPGGVDQFLARTTGILSSVVALLVLINQVRDATQ